MVRGNVRFADVPSVEYGKDGKLHRDGDFPVKIQTDGLKMW